MGDSEFLSFEQLKGRYLAVSWVVNQLIPADATGIIFGETGSYKSFIAIDLSLHIAYGLPWCGNKTNQGSVYFIAGEGGAGLCRRIEAWHKYHKLLPEAGQLFVFPIPIALDDPDNANEVTRLIKQRAETADAPKLIVIDTLSQNFSGVENDSSDIADYLRTLISRIRSHFPGSSIVIIHHTGHSNQDRPRGASSLIANSDFIYMINGSNLSTVLTAQKMKDSELPKPTLFNLEVIELEKDADGKAITSLVAVFDGIKPHGTKVNKRTSGKHTANFFKALTDLGNHTTEAQLREEFIKLSPNDNRDTILKAFTRELNNQITADAIIAESGQIRLFNVNQGGQNDKT